MQWPIVPVDHVWWRQPPTKVHHGLANRHGWHRVGRGGRPTLKNVETRHPQRQANHCKNLLANFDQQTDTPYQVHIKDIQSHMGNGMQKRDTSRTDSGNSAAWNAAGWQQRRFARPGRSIWWRGAAKFGKVISTPCGNNIPRCMGFPMSVCCFERDNNCRS